jgi:hypothetical protein
LEISCFVFMPLFTQRGLRRSAFLLLAVARLPPTRRGQEQQDRGRIEQQRHDQDE